MLQTSISACDVPTQKEWYKQQISQFTNRIIYLNKRIKELKNEMFSYCQCHATNIYLLQTMKRDNPQYKYIEDKVHMSFKKINEALFALINVQYKLAVDERILSELKKENKKLYRCVGGFYE